MAAGTKTTNESVLGRAGGPTFLERPSLCHDVADRDFIWVSGS